MPTKRNYGGEQQNYVPKGNEAGGQWGDDETGSNVNWKNPNAKESDLVKGVEKGFGLEAKKKTDDDKNAPKVGVRSLIEKSRSPWKDAFLKSYDKGSETSKAIIDKIGNRLTIKIASKGGSYYTPIYGSVHLNSHSAQLTLNVEGWYDDESTIYHEFGHALDYQLFEKILKGKRQYLGETISNKYVTKNGKTLLENIKEEMTPQVCERIVDDYMKEVKKAEDYRQARVAKAKYADLSDMREAQSGKMGFAVGHMIKDPNYWNDGGENQATEAFAQLFSAKSSSNPERYKLLKKYIPNTCKAFDEIYQKMKGIK